MLYLYPAEPSNSVEAIRPWRSILPMADCRAPEVQNVSDEIPMTSPIQTLNTALDSDQIESYRPPSEVEVSIHEELIETAELRSLSSVDTFHSTMTSVPDGVVLPVAE